MIIPIKRILQNQFPNLTYKMAYESDTDYSYVKNIDSILSSPSIRICKIELFDNLKINFISIEASVYTNLKKLSCLNI